MTDKKPAASAAPQAVKPTAPKLQSVTKIAFDGRITAADSAPKPSKK